MTLQSLARTIAKARHGTDAMWANYMGAAEAARREVVEECAAVAKRVATEIDSYNTAGYLSAVEIESDIRSLIAQPATNDDVPVYLERP